jgi:hypothetical protein
MIGGDLHDRSMLVRFAVGDSDPHQSDFPTPIPVFGKTIRANLGCSMCTAPNMESESSVTLTCVRPESTVKVRPPSARLLECGTEWRCQSFRPSPRLPFCAGSS